MRKNCCENKVTVDFEHKQTSRILREKPGDLAWLIFASNRKLNAENAEWNSIACKNCYSVKFVQMSFFQARVSTRFGLRTLRDRPFNDTNCAPLSLWHWICTVNFLIAKTHRIMHLNSVRRKNRAQYRVAVQSWRRRNREKKAWRLWLFSRELITRKLA